MTPRRLYLSLAACIGALAMALALLSLAQAARPLPASAPTPLSLPAAVYAPDRAVSNTLPFDYVSALVTLAERPDFIALAGYSQSGPAQVLWSADGGKAWWPLPLPPDLSFWSVIGLTSRADPAQPVRFLIGDGRTLYRSGDFGLTWTESFSQTAENGEEGCGMDLQVSQAQPQLLYLSAECRYFPLLRSSSPNDSYKAYVSEDGGVSWRELRVFPQNFVPSPAAPNRVYGGYALDFYSDDRGGSWQPLPSSWDMDNAILDRVEPDTIYGDQITYETISGTTYYKLLQKTSFDNGVTWRDWASDPCAQPDAHGPTFYVPFISSGRHQLWVGCDDTDDPHYSDELFYSDDAGDTWRAMGEIPVAVDYGHQGHVLMLNDQGLWRSVDGGDWTLVTADFAAPPRKPLYLPAILR